MLLKILKFFLRKRNKKHLIPFIDGLVNLGRPSDIAFPPELLEQGFALLLSGLNNTMAIHSNLDWLWPYWVEAQQRPDSKQFIPTGVNTLTVNLTNRNWVSLGIKGSTIESMIDQVGMLTPFRFGWSILPYLNIDNMTYAPPLIRNDIKQYLKNDYLPEVITEYTGLDKLNWQSRTKAVLIENEETVLIKHLIKNLDTKARKMTFGLSIRPYNTLTIGHIHRIKFKNGFWRVNNKPALLLPENPDRIKISDRHIGDPIYVNRPSVFLNDKYSSTGLLSGTAEYDISLEPDEEKEIYSLASLGKYRRSPNRKFKHITINKIHNAEEQFYKETDRFKRSGFTIKSGSEKIDMVFYSIKCRMHIFDDMEHFSPGTFFYHHHWVRDAAFIAMAFLNLGDLVNVKQKLENMFKIQDEQGFFKSQNGEWDSNGQALFLINKYIKRSNDYEFAKKHLSKLMCAFNWIQQTRSKSKSSLNSHYGLLPAGFSAEHFGPNDHYYWDNFWSLAGIKSLMETLYNLGKFQDHHRVRDEYEAYLSDLKNSINIKLEKEESKILPSSPYRRADSASIGNLIALSPLDLYKQDYDWIKETAYYLFNKCTFNGMFFQKIIHTGLNAYLSTHLAKTFLFIDNNISNQILDAIIEYGNKTKTWPEAINPISRGGCMGDGDHGWAAADIFNLIRSFLILEHHNTIYFAIGIQLESILKNEISVNSAATDFGIFSYQLSIGEETVDFNYNFEKTCPEDINLVLILPNQLELKYVKLKKFNESSNFIEIETDKTEYHFQYNTKKPFREIKNAI